MTFHTGGEDTSKALFSEGSWHIMHKDIWQNKYFELYYKYDSVIFHQCRNHWKKHEDSDVWVPSVQYRITVAELNIPCSHCKEVCPEGLQGLWKLHNYNSIQSDHS